MDKLYLTTKEAAEYLGLPVTTFRLDVTQRKVVPDVTMGKTFGFTRETLDRYGASRRSNKSLSPEQWEAIRTRYQAGEKPFHLAREFGISPYYLTRKVGPRESTYCSGEAWHQARKRAREEKNGG